MTQPERKEWKAWKDEVTYLLKNNGFHIRWIWDNTTKNPDELPAFCLGLSADEWCDVVVMGPEAAAYQVLR